MKHTAIFLLALFVVSLQLSLSGCAATDHPRHGKLSAMWPYVEHLDSPEFKAGLLRRDSAYVTQTGHGALVEAALFGYTDVVKALAKDKKLLEQQGDEAIYWAASMGRIKTIQVLLDAGISSNATISNGATPIFSAIENGEIDAACFLLSNGANINHRANMNVSLMKLAIFTGNPDAVKLLLENQYKPKNIEEKERSIQMAERLKQNDMVSMLTMKTYALDRPKICGRI